MAIRIYKDNIKRDFSVLGNNVYLGNGQSCGTIWYRSVPIARKALKATNKIVSGADMVDCKKCRCNYSITDSNYYRYPEFICKKAKEDYAKKFEVQ